MRYTLTAFENVTPGDRFEAYRQATSNLEYVGMFEVEAESPEAALEVGFAIGNIGQPDIFGATWPRSHRSQSVGDVVIITVHDTNEKQAWACSFFGWSRLDGEPSQTYKR